MRVQGVTGDLPAVTHAGPAVPPVVPPVEDTTRRPAVAAPPAGDGADLGHGAADDHLRRPLQPLPSFDPPLIAQRAVLGWPVGPLVVEHARATGVSYGAVWAQVDRAMAAVAHEEPAAGA